MGGSTVIQVWTVLPEYCEQFSMRGVPNLGIVLPEHVELCFIRISLLIDNLHWISTKNADKITITYKWLHQHSPWWWWWVYGKTAPSWTVHRYVVSRISEIIGKYFINIIEHCRKLRNLKYWFVIRKCLLFLC